MSDEVFVDVDERRLDGELWAVSPKEGVMTAEALHHVREGLCKAAPEKRFVVFAGPVDLVPLTSLDAAWAAAESALPAGWTLEVGNHPSDGYWTQALGPEVDGRHPFQYASGATPTVALQALTAALATPVTREGGEPR